MKLLQLLIWIMKIIIWHEIENILGSEGEWVNILATSGQGRPLWGGICTKISKMKNVAAMQISGQSFPTKAFQDYKQQAQKLLGEDEPGDTEKEPLWLEHLKKRDNIGYF